MILRGRYARQMMRSSTVIAISKFAKFMGVHGANFLASKHQRMMLPKQGKMCQRPLSSCGAQETAPPQLPEAMPPWTAERRRDAWRAKNIGSREFGIPMSECISDH
jgi:hypothetical protein